MIGRVVQLSVYGQVRNAQRAILEMRGRQWRTHCDSARPNQIDRAPQSHILVWRTGIPVYPVDAQFILSGSKSLHRQYVLFATGR